MPSPVSFIGRALRNRRADETRSIVHHDGLAAPAELHIESADFADGAPMPYETTLMGDNQSPALTWSGVPEGTQQLVLVIEDTDVPFKTPGIHTVALLPPTLTEVGRGQLGEKADRFLTALLGKAGYYGPGPLPGHGPHRYGFHLYALSAPLPATVTKAKELADAAAGTVLARGSLTGTYERP
ncbi:MAG: hypothetical protein J2O46_03740 [Nocardioides sp.]|nr:hypothetical protein [Nocardioides sp.]